MTRKRWIWLGVALFAAALAAWLLFGRAEDPAERYRTAEVARGPLRDAVTANGTLNPVRVVSVGSQVSGTISRINADFNDRVSAGQVLAVIDPRLFEARLRASEANLQQLRAQAALQSANARRAAELRARGFVSEQAFDNARAQAEVAAAQVRAAQAQLAQDRTNLSFTVIRSPVAGVVMSRQVDVGQTVAASFQTPTLFTIARDLTRMQIEAAVAEADVAKVRVGQRVAFTVDAYGAREFAGEVQEVRLNPTTQQNVVTYTVVVAVPNADGALLPGMTANARFLVRDYAQALLLPNAALSWKPQDWTADDARALAARDPLGKDPAAVTLFRLGAGGPEPVRVKLGAADPDNSVVTAGALKAGDKVIVGLVDEEPKP